jgi:hypothetical protein
LTFVLSVITSLSFSVIASEAWQSQHPTSEIATALLLLAMTVAANYDAFISAHPELVEESI